MSYPLAQIAEALNAALKGPAPRPNIRSILLDSRRLFHPEGVLFVAIEGQRHNGHDYIEELYERGVRAFLTSTHFTCESFPEASFLQVEDTLKGLQELAGWHRQHFHLPVVGITGSNGKTIVKEWLYQLLQADYHIVRSPRSYNSQVGVPLSVWQLQKEHDLALFEAGISLPGEMDRLQRVIQPTIGILTNIGDAHDEGFRDSQHKMREKCRLFREVELLIANLDDPQLRKEVDRLGVPCFTWSFESDADLKISNCAQQPDGSTMLHAQYRGTPWRMRIPFSDRASLENAVSCWCLLLQLGYSQTQIAARLARLEPVEMRLELLEGIRGCRLINDSYNSDLTSLGIALDFMGQQTRNGRRTLILSDLLQSGLPKAELYRRVAGLLTEKQVDRLLGVGSDMPILKQLLPPSLEAHFFEDTAALARQLDRLPFREETILLKGARRFGFEYLARRLARTAHRATLEVDLTAMAKNLNTYHRLLKPRVGMMVMVKAEAYGTGSMEVARLLEYHKVSYLGVAYTDEGIELRQGGIQSPILVLNPEPADYEAMLRYRLEPEIYSPAMLRSFLAFSDRSGEALPFHLKLDTGMRRLGFAPD
jgi:alanine racemase